MLTAHLVLQAIDEEEARRIRDRRPDAGDRWADDYPFEGDLAAVGAFLRAVEQDDGQRDWGYFQIRLRPDGAAIGGIGFKGAPSGGAVEVGYGLVPSARGRGRAAEALRAIVALAAERGVELVRADTEEGNTASQRVLRSAGFSEVRADGDVRWFAVRTPGDVRGPA